jgi:hypothetical protein
MSENSSNPAAAQDDVQITEGGITDVNGLTPLGGSSDVGGTGTPDATADIGASTGAAGLLPTGTVIDAEAPESEDIRDSDLLGGDIIHREKR